MKMRTLAVSGALLLAGSGLAWAATPAPEMGDPAIQATAPAPDMPMPPPCHHHGRGPWPGDAGMGRDHHHEGYGMPPASVALTLFGIGPFGVQPMPPQMAAMPHGAAGKQSAEDAAKLVKAQTAEMQRRARWAERRQMHRMEERVAAADGTPEQAQQVQTRMHQAFADLQPLQAQLYTLDQRAQTLYQAPSLDRAAFEALRVERNKLMEQISAHALQAWLDIAGLFTPEQRKRLAFHPMPPHAPAGGAAHRAPPPPATGAPDDMPEHGAPMP
ncbi:MAG: hypothetical protein Q4B13_03930 [Lautropia sp.]|nr:hypothetical protein [Lautropia sp.]